MNIVHTRMVVNKDQTPKKLNWQEIILLVGGMALAAYFSIKLLGQKESHTIKRRIFISHSWTKDKDFKGLIKKFKKVGFEFYNHSVTSDNPLTAESRRDLKNKLRRKMIHCSKFVLIAGNYVNDSKVIRDEIKIAKELKKEIIAIRPWAQKSVPVVVKNNADIIVGMNTENIISKLNEN